MNLVGRLAAGSVFVSTYLPQYLEGHGTVMVLQGRDVVVPDSQLRPRIDLVTIVTGMCNSEGCM